MIRDIATTAIQGADVFHDIFIVILRIPASLRTFLVEGAFSNAFIPTYSSLIGKNKLNESCILKLDNFSCISHIFVINSNISTFPNFFVLLFASGYYGDESKLQIASEFNRIMFPYLGFIAMVSFAGGIQNANNKFGVPAATPILFNITLISTAIFAKDFLVYPYTLLSGVFCLLGYCS